MVPVSCFGLEGFNESFENNNIINNLKLRLGWGVVGNQNVPNNAYKAIYSSVATVWEQVAG